MGNSSLRTGVQRRAVEAEGGGVRVPRVRCVLGLDFENGGLWEGVMRYNYVEYV